MGRRWGTNQRFPPAHLRGGFNFSTAVPECIGKITSSM
jgi:hypothetical protein